MTVSSKFSDEPGITDRSDGGESESGEGDSAGLDIGGGVRHEKILNSVDEILTSFRSFLGGLGELTSILLKLVDLRNDFVDLGPDDLVVLFLDEVVQDPLDGLLLAHFSIAVSHGGVHLIHSFGNLVLRGVAVSGDTAGKCGECESETSHIYYSNLILINNQMTTVKIFWKKIL